MANTSSTSILFIFGLSAAAILVLMATPICLLYCSQGGCRRIVQRLTPSNRPRYAKDIEASAPVEPVNAIQMKQRVHSETEKPSNRKDEEVCDDVFIIGDDEEDEDPFGDKADQGNASVTASITKYYFADTNEGNAHRFSLMKDADMLSPYHWQDLDELPKEIVLDDSSSFYSFDDDAQHVGLSTEIRGRDSLDSVSSLATGRTILSRRALTRGNPSPVELHIAT